MFIRLPLLRLSILDMAMTESQGFDMKGDILLQMSFLKGDTPNIPLLSCQDYVGKPIIREIPEISFIL
jgi:hypothetical protein